MNQGQCTKRIIRVFYFFKYVRTLTYCFSVRASSSPGTTMLLRLGLTALPQLPSYVWGAGREGRETKKGKRREGGKGRERGKEGRGKWEGKMEGGEKGGEGK